MMYRQHLLPCARCAAMRCPCPPEPTVLEVELLHALGKRPEKFPKPHRSERRRALDANQPGMPSDSPQERLGAAGACPRTPTRDNAVSGRPWSYRKESAA